MEITNELTAADLLAAWDAGESVWSVEMGGLGPSYEQAIQVLIVELVRDHIGTPLPDVEAMEKQAREDWWWTWGDDTARRLNEACGGFSGAQVGAAKSVAIRILRDGYAATLASMREHDSDRLIQASKRFPHVPEVPA